MSSGVVVVWNARLHWSTVAFVQGCSSCPAKPELQKLRNSPSHFRDAIDQKHNGRLKHQNMNSVRAIQQLNKRELEAGITPEGSWHTDYRDTAFVYIGGLPFELSEGDIITIFSQYGEPVWVKLARDHETGKSRGFAWIKYEDQKSCDLAVDNLGGASIMDRVLRVDHARYKPKDDEDMRDNTMGELDLDPANESDGGRRKRRKTESESDDDEDRPLLPEEIELERLMENLDEDDPMRDSMIKTQQEKVDDAIKKMQKQKRREKEKARKKDKHRRRGGSKDRDRDRDRRKIKDMGEDNDRDKRSRRKELRSKSRDGDSDEDRRHRKSRQRDGSEERDRRHRSERTRERSDDQEDRSDRHRRRDRQRSASVDEDQGRTRSKGSPLPYRARSPR
ncbi:RNA-binding domain-containing protein [Clathrospora elynae]|uniref:RNA-binding domain-containing protein n=1 Tax=Clathrospora elynae TaxID=706981 RepID=A0A6A5SG61_9PLEO|nr:RNA-binding domain-containing protein [Clathrospora elynae]